MFLQAVDHLESFIADCDRRTELAKKRLAETQEEISAEVAAKVRGETREMSERGRKVQTLHYCAASTGSVTG